MTAAPAVDTQVTAALHGVSMAFGGRPVLRDVSARFAAGTTYVLRGPSGAGKSTLLNLLAGYLEPDRGRVTRAASTGYVLQDDMLFSALTVRQNLQVRGAALGLTPAEREPLLLRCLERANVLPLADASVAHLSGGERQRVQLASLLMAPVDLLLLDEPTSRLDPANRRELAAAVRELFAGRTLLVVTHDEDSPFAGGNAVALALRDGRIGDA